MVSGGTKCCVPNCKKETALHNKEISFHRFPKDEKIRQVWISRVNRIGTPRKRGIKENSQGNSIPWTPTKFHLICGTHFNESGKKRYEDTFPRFFPYKTFPPMTKAEAFKSILQSDNTSTTSAVEECNLQPCNQVYHFDPVVSENCVTCPIKVELESPEIDCSMPHRPYYEETYNTELDLDEDLDSKSHIMAMGIIGDDNLRSVQFDHTYNLPITEHHVCALKTTELQNEVTRLSEASQEASVQNQRLLDLSLQNGELRKRLEEKTKVISKQRIDIARLNSAVTYYKKNTDSRLRQIIRGFKRNKKPPL